jgi:hypothetical protein
VDRNQAAKLLDVPVDASQNEVRKAFRRLAQATHPDRGGSAEDFLVIRRAYDILTSKIPPDRSPGVRPRSKQRSGPIGFGSVFRISSLFLDGKKYGFSALARVMAVDEELLVEVDLPAQWKDSSGRAVISLEEEEGSSVTWDREIISRSYGEKGLASFWISPFLRRMRVDGIPVDEYEEPVDPRFARPPRPRFF